MRGVILGDVMGSIYEWKPVEEQQNIKDPVCITDDTVLCTAVTEALLDCRDQNITDDEGIVRKVGQKLQEYGRRYPEAGYSRTFRKWTESDDPKPYGSKTNGAIMRCAAAGWLAGSAEEARRLGRLTAMPTHDHPEAVQAAALTAEVIYRLRMGESIERVHALVEESYVIPKLADIRPIKEFDFTCKTTLPIAFAAFYETVTEGLDSFELMQRVVKNAISLGGDTDTNAAIAAAFAEAWLYAFSCSYKWQACDASYRAYWHEEKSAHYASWYKVCPEEILQVAKRLDEAVQQISPLRQHGKWFYRVDGNGEAVILHRNDKFNNTNSVFVIPAEVDGFPVTAVEPCALKPRFSGIHCDCVIPEGVRWIGDYAFGSSEADVTVPKSALHIGRDAFVKGKGVIILPSHLKTPAMSGTRFVYYDGDPQEAKKSKEYRLSAALAAGNSEREREHQRQNQQDQYELREVSIQRYAGWREHAEESGYIIDALDRVYERVPKK